MADSDSRKVRPLRHPAESPSFDAEDDPLVELARMVSEDSGFSAGKGEKPRAQRDEPIDRNALSADLEAELLQELEASFAPRPPLKAVAARAPVAPSPPPADDADDLLRSIEEQLGAFERSARPTHSAAAEPGESREYRERPAETRSEEAEEERPAEMAGEDLREEELEQRGAPARMTDEEREIRRGPGVLLRAAAWPDRNPRPRPQRPEPRFAREAPDEGRQEAARENRRAAARQFRRERQTGSRLGPAKSDVERAGSVASGIVGAAAGWDQIAGEEEKGASAERESGSPRPEGDYRRELRTTFGDLDEAQEPSPPVVFDTESFETGLAAEIEPSYSDASLGENWQDEAYPDAETPPDEPRVAAAAPARRNSREESRKGVLVVAGVLGVVVLGGAAAFFMRGGDAAPSGPPPVISAQDGPVKVTPPEESEQAAEETIGEAVYNRVAGGANETEEQIVNSAEEPEEIPRIVLPAPQAEADVADPAGDAESEIAVRGTDAPAGNAESEADAAPVEAPAGPRRVRTFVVRPDGSIVTAAEPASGASTPSEAPAQDRSLPAAASMDVEPIEPAAVSTIAVNGAGEPDSASAEANTAATSNDPVEAENAPASEAAAEPADSVPGIRAGVDEAAAADAADSAPGIRAGVDEAPVADAAEDVTAAAADSVDTAAVEPSPAPEAPPRRSQARNEDSAPVDLLSAAAAPREEPAPPPGAATGDGWVVQISSQRTREEAQSSWDSMRGRYPSVLGDLQPSIQETDLGDRGIYHRLRVGPWPTRAEAIEVCEALQAAGGTCFVAQ